ncbi:hypothetical protein A9Q84_12960 [Halobacteriovorax marinus]|uniref:Uncharacterized protein n=1 Tax=Halobacteriovorax marinus TaxID=97084 RepID=A0A1Y5FEB0_9BACT|nr:hypothetical protein A9Q84_12960 [Halobacteriovorax marinus]
MTREWIIFLIMLISVSSNALVPLESILLGDFSKRYSKESEDPFDYLYKRNGELEGKQAHKRQLTIYRGFYEEGKNLQNSCKSSDKVGYATPWQKDQVRRSLLATLQYIGLDISIRAIPQYAKYFEFSRDEYVNMVDNLVGNYCSKNLSIISLKQLRKNFLVRYDEENTFKLPSIEGNTLFPEKLSSIANKDDAKEREFLKTIRLFQSFCSWGGDIENLRLLVPFIKHPVIYKLLMRQISGRNLDWKENSRSVISVRKQKTIKVLCDGLICRKVKSGKFYKYFPTSVGHKSFDDDLGRLYCQEIRDVDYKIKGQAPKIAKIIKSMTFDEENLLVAQFISLQTGIPDLFIRSNNYKSAINFLRFNIDKTWNDWSDSQIDRFQGEVYYEEPLTMELVERSLYYKNYVAKFQVIFDVNLGELDRANQKVGKISTKFTIPFSNKFLKWARSEWIALDPRNKKRKDELFSKMKIRIQPIVENIRKKFPVAPWNGNLHAIIRNELLDQLSLYQGPYFKENTTGMVKVPIKINFAPYALKYLRYEYKVKQNEEKSRRQDKLFKLKEIEENDQL